MPDPVRSMDADPGSIGCVEGDEVVPGACDRTELKSPRRSREHRPKRPLWQRGLALLLEIACVLALAAVIPGVLSDLLHTQYPLATITSSSMWPTLRRGDLVVVKGLDSEVVVGQVVVYLDVERATMIIHRVISVDGDEVVTQGDANAEPDEPITTSDVVGVIPTVGDSLLHVPYLGYVTLFVNGES